VQHLFHSVSELFIFAYVDCFSITLAGSCGCRVIFFKYYICFRHNNQRFAICYGLSDEEAHRVSVTDNEGNILYSFGGKRPGSGHEELNRPIQLAVDTDLDVIFVMDSGNNAVKILRLSDAKLLDVFVHAEMHDPRRLSVDSSMRHMAVANEDGRILLFSY